MPIKPLYALSLTALLLCACGRPIVADTEASHAEPAESAIAMAPAKPPVGATSSDAVPPEIVASSTASESMTCLAERGQKAAENLVKRCVQVSPATHPPCNVQNPCGMIQAEIDRSCAMYGPDETKPAQCAA